jgi:hypothetical protein
MSYSFTGEWVHDLDRWLTTDPRDEAKPVHICKHGCEIYEGETYYEIDGNIYCENCIEESRKEAEFDYPEDYDDICE